MNHQEEQQGANDSAPTEDSANNEVGPTEKLRDPNKAEGELSVPGAQNPKSENIKDEQGPNTE